MMLCTASLDARLLLWDLNKHVIVEEMLGHRLVGKDSDLPGSWRA